MEIIKTSRHLEPIHNSPPGNKAYRWTTEKKLNPAIKKWGVIFATGAAAVGIAAILLPIIFGASSGATRFPPASKPQRR